MIRNPIPQARVHDPDRSLSDSHLRVVEPGERSVPAIGADFVTLSAALRRMAPHPDPLVVFDGLVRLLVPAVCDEAVCSADAPSVFENGPAGGAAADEVQSGPGRYTASIAVTVAASPPADASVLTMDDVVRLTCVWQEHRPTRAEIALVGLLGQYAAGIVRQARQDAALQAADRRVDHLQRALTTNRTIGAAIGVLMVRHGVTYDKAHDLLATRSQLSNTKMVALADHVLFVGELP